MKLLGLFTSIALFIFSTIAVDLDISDKDSICSAAALIADGTLDYYEGDKYGGTVGMFSNPYYWWESGEAMGSLIGHWFFCQNDTYEDLIYNALIAQKGDDNDYIPKNQSTTEGNDDQGFWGIAVLEAAERNFTNPKDDDTPGWIAMAQAVFNTMWLRWDPDHCGGGLRWQIFTWNSGYSYKNTISTACMFNIACRLGRYTGNDTYFDVAEKAYQWLVDVKFVVEGDEMQVYDGAEIDDNCTDITKSEWSYNYGLLLAGCAYAYNSTEDDTWGDRVDSLLKGCDIFFEDDIMYEKGCQSSGTCNNDQRSFKSIFSRSLGQTAQLVPSTASTIQNWLQKSAEGAAKSCSGGTDGHTCGLDWTKGSWDNKYGLGEEISALEVIQNLLIDERPAPLTNDTGGTSKGDASAGSNPSGSQNQLNQDDLKITGRDKAGSGILTAIVLSALVGGAIWMIL
ncbi:Mannan endo-1,6-alpha-mannosidase [Wickerhamomyces ciferrii]|uniref:Mannan endo-1,6-alpha-mannosidase n=1 Tax=Wickerhamomyces ciferrii (strain ATCC 14091 / BCRC 22168 / CBS 111 / JCM 3599 / NBRC 0793 / NRRL Y-1031 F-60-10) TaxID=1206466 RepID=K0KQQ4_WICCF|nr:Mannan endo-1,6-alpha-mannosidase [Wickerhamomyces ciferrii]CCH45401.1 Mannan endo-1,6-alpha-mannosidase [Wickerhamomyces ciferrii]